MNLRSTLDPISRHEVSNRGASHCLFEGDGDNGIEVYFENKADRDIYRDLARITGLS